MSDEELKKVRKELAEHRGMPEEEIGMLINNVGPEMMGCIKDMEQLMKKMHLMMNKKIKDCGPSKEEFSSTMVTIFEGGALMVASLLSVFPPEVRGVMADKAKTYSKDLDKHMEYENGKKGKD